MFTLLFPCPCYLDALLRLMCLYATSKFMNEFYYVRFGAELSVLMLERTIVLTLDYISETRK